MRKHLSNRYFAPLTLRLPACSLAAKLAGSFATSPALRAKLPDGLTPHAASRRILQGRTCHCGVSWPVGSSLQHGCGWTTERVCVRGI